MNSVNCLDSQSVGIDSQIVLDCVGVDSVFESQVSKLDFKPTLDSVFLTFRAWLCFAWCGFYLGLPPLAKLRRCGVAWGVLAGGGRSCLQCKVSASKSAKGAHHVIATRLA